MSRSFKELMEDYEADPSGWEIIKTETVPSTNRRNPGGSSVQELLRNKTTGEEMVRHTVLKPDGKIFSAPHLRPSWR
jgi:hypothetical protein